MVLGLCVSVHEHTKLYRGPVYEQGVRDDADGEAFGLSGREAARVLVDDDCGLDGDLLCNIGSEKHGILRWAVGPEVMGGCPVW